jgi:hypothetical protein
MGFRFRKRLRIFPGLWLNLSKKGGSLSVGGRGATVNVSPKGHQGTVGLHGIPA